MYNGKVLCQFICICIVKRNLWALNFVGLSVSMHPQSCIQTISTTDVHVDHLFHVVIDLPIQNPDAATSHMRQGHTICTHTRYMWLYGPPPCSSTCCSCKYGEKGQKASFCFEDTVARRTESSFSSLSISSTICHVPVMAALPTAHSQSEGQVWYTLKCRPAPTLNCLNLVLSTRKFLLLQMHGDPHCRCRWTETLTADADDWRHSLKVEILRTRKSDVSHLCHLSLSIA